LIDQADWRSSDDVAIAEAINEMESELRREQVKQSSSSFFSLSNPLLLSLVIGSLSSLLLYKLLSS
jgi:hypothetical protein